MKKNTLLFIVALFDFLLAQVNIDSGLIVYLPFNGNTRDYSGRNNHGFCATIRYAADRLGNLSAACFFPACYQSDRRSMIQIPFSSDFDFSGTKAVSVGFWADTTAISFSNFNMDFYDCFECFQFTLGMDEVERSKMWITLRGSHCWLILDSGTKDLAGWHHYFMTLDNDLIRLYIDGKFIDSLAVYNVRWQLPSMHHLMISKTGFCHRSSHERGSIDSFRLYNRCLSADEVQATYTRRD